MSDKKRMKELPFGPTSNPQEYSATLRMWPDKPVKNAEEFRDWLRGKIESSIKLGTVLVPEHEVMTIYKDTEVVWER